MNDRKRILVSSILILAGVALVGGAVAIAVLYRTAFAKERLHLAEIARGQARFMEAVARFDATHSQGAHPEGAEAATLSQINDAHEHYQGFGKTGEFVVARREVDQIVFLFPYRHGDGGDPEPIPWASGLAEPMRLALSSKDGTLIGLDYRGERVLAAHEPVAVLGLGVVAKMDLAEVRAPFVRAGVIVGAATFLLVLVGAGLTLRVTDPVLRRLGLFQRFAEESGHGLAMADLNRRITYVNPALCRMLGVDGPEDLLGKTFDPFYSEEARRRVNEEIIPTVLEEGQWKGELAQLSKKGQVSPTFENIFLIRDEKGKPLCLADVMTNITERKRAEWETREARRAAEAANQTKSEFLANMSHEIRTPMTAILGFAENLLETDQTESERLNAVHTILRNGKYLLAIINDILDLSKIEAGKMVVERAPCNPCQIVAEVASLVRVSAEAKGLPFNIEYIGAIPETVLSEPTRVRQILVNLIGNAIKFTEVGSVRLLTRCVDEGDEPRLQFDVIDTGRGMRAEQVAKLFQPFTQADVSTTRMFGGTGLGLTISKRFAELLGGDIAVVETKEGVGTTVRATVATGPLDGVTMLDDPMSATLVADAQHTEAGSERSGLGGCRILLAEDGPDNRRLIAHVLRKAGAEVVMVENGKLAVDAALAARDEARPFDVILMDMQMPVTDGYEATRQLRRKGHTGPIIALTAHSMATDREKCIRAGCTEYTSKPINRMKLIEIIQGQLQRTVAPAGAS